MTNEAIFVFSLIGVAGALMASNRVRFDIVALLVVLALMLSGVLSAGDSLAGFGSSVVILVAGLWLSARRWHKPASFTLLATGFSSTVAVTKHGS